MAQYRTRAGDVLDAICWAYYGQSPGYVEAVLDHNPRLAELGPVFEAGVEIELPDLPNVHIQNAIRLWD